MRVVLFVCVHNAGRSQMAEAFFNALAKERNSQCRAISAGTEAADRINPVARQAMSEVGLTMEHQRPKLLTQKMADGAERIITMGCGVDAATCPAKVLFSDDWGLDDPAGQPIGMVRCVRDEIKVRVLALLNELDGVAVP